MKARSGKGRSGAIQTILPAQLLRLLASGRRLLLLDVREPAEVAGPLGRLPGARHVPLGRLFSRREELARAKVDGVVTISNTGVRAREAAFTLSLLGLPEVQSLEGGLEAWRRERLPLAFAT